MSATFEDLRILKLAEGVADEVWKRVSQWDVFAKEVVGVQLAKAADSVGANIAESFGRYNFGENFSSFIMRAEVCSRRSIGSIAHGKEN